MNPAQPASPAPQQPVQAPRPGGFSDFRPASPTPAAVNSQPQANVTPAAPAFRPAAPSIAQPQAPAFTRPAQPDPLDQIGRVSLDTFDPKAQSKKSTFPKGLIAIGVVSLVGLAVGFVDKTQNSLIYTIVLGFDVLLAIDLLVRRQEPVRKVAMGLAIATVTVSAALVLGYRGLIDNTANAETLFIAEAKKLQNQSPTKQLTDEQQQHLDAMQLQLEAQQNSVGENSTLVYGKYGVSIVVFAGVALYLTRPKVKEAFEATIK